MEDRDGEPQQDQRTRTKDPSRARALRETWSSGTPEDVHDAVKDRVVKGIAAAAGALEGFTAEARREKLPQQAQRAVASAGDAARSVLSSASEETSQIKGPLREASERIGQTAREIGTTIRSEAEKTREVVKGERPPDTSTTGNAFGAPGPSSRRRPDDIDRPPAPVSGGTPSTSQRRFPEEEDRDP